MAPKKDRLNAPATSTTSVLAGIVQSFATLTLDVNPGNGRDVELNLQDGRKILEFSEIVEELGKMAGLLDESTAEVNAAGLAHAATIDRLSAPWLPLQGPDSSDADRAAVQEELFDALKGLNTSLESGGFVGGGSLKYGDMVVLPAVLWLWRYVLGEDVKSGLANVHGWIGRMLDDERVVAGVGGT